MSSTNVARGAASGRLTGPMRIPPISADLLPDEIRDARANRRRRRQAIAGLVGAAVLVGSAWAGVLALSTAARMQQELVEADVAAVQRQQGEFAPLIETQTKAAAINKQLAALMADDVRWQRVLRGIQQAAPSAVKVGSLNANVTAFEGGAGSAPAAGPPTVSAPGGGDRVIGKITLSGTATRKTDVARFLTDLENVNGIDRPLLDSYTGTAFNLHMDLTAAALGGRFGTPAQGGN
ncbi:hypothetical protein GCM10010124_21620 [Pilimelia terevasa]|uniref:Uncharacterized protein n=1 Tax=Pilimelia terevasa TaxID=53372 RepID=A0A8J3BQF1_9ACTN|nr:hypothetical protein [Pilimelia terevasa]GGK28593.1 hypothetical protein GCM10010124_21620 [Pilimelia terevasa]